MKEGLEPRPRGAQDPKLVSAKWSTEQKSEKCSSQSRGWFRNESQTVKTGLSWGDTRYYFKSSEAGLWQNLGASQAPSSPPLVRILPPEYFMVIGRHQVDHFLTSSTTTFRILLFPASNQQRPGDVFLPFFSLFPCSPSSRLHPTLSFACHNYTLSLLEGH